MTTKALTKGVEAHPVGRLDARTLLKWLRDDDLITSDDASQTARRFAGAQSVQHPLVRLGSAGLVRHKDGKILDTDALTEWLAVRSGIPFLRIDPLKVDVGRVAEIMSINYAERRRSLPLNVGARDITIATSEPFDIDRKSTRLNSSHPSKSRMPSSA